MTYATVDFYVTNPTPSALPIQGTVVKILSPDGVLVYGQATSDSEGHAGFLLPSGQEYQARFYRFATSFTNPLLFNVLDPPATNTFNVKGATLTPPVPTDARLCTAYGYFRTVTGAPAVGVDIQLIAQFHPILLEGAAALTERAIVRTDKNGYAQVNLIRLGHYQATIAGCEDMTRTLRVPDAPNVNLPDLCFPVVSSIVLDPPPPYALTVGVDLIVTPTVLTSDGNTLCGIAMGDVIYRSGDTAVAAVLPTGNTLVLRGLAAGTTTLDFFRRDATIVRYPDPGILGTGAAITVT